MGVVYVIYAEIKYNGRWYSLNPVRKSIVDGGCKIEPLFCGKSFLHDAFEELEESSHRGFPDDLSEELSNHFSLDRPYSSHWPGNNIKTYRDWYNHIGFYVDYVRTVELRMANTPRKEFKGFVKKTTIAKYQLYEIDEICDYLTNEEYFDLPAEKQKKYSYFEWDDRWFGYYKVFKSLINKITFLTELFIEGLRDIPYEQRRIALEEECCNNIRLICYAS